MNVAMPHGTTHGWGIAGSYLTSEIARLRQVPNVTLHCVAGHHFAPSDESQWNHRNIGYCFFEHEILAYRFIPEAAKRWDHIVAGSSWCEHHLRIAGMERASTILQGIDPAIFKPLPPRRDDGRFIIFSGGKFEFRKSHDLVMAAMRVFMARHTDVWLACSWHNHWPQSILTMGQSRFINFRYRDVPCDQLYLELLVENGIDPGRVILFPVTENHLMGSLYADTDLGLFPNRCEGGNNMVMCEYMACGRPVIASTMTGHRDVVEPAHALCLTAYEPVLARIGDDITGVWFEPALEEIIALLEQAYQDRRALNSIGTTAGLAMKRLSWGAAALSFHALACNLTDQPNERVKLSGEKDAYELFTAEHFEEAAAGFRAMLARNPLDPDLHNCLATALDRTGRYIEATLHYEKALALRPRFVTARFNLANTLKRLGDGTGARDNLEQVVAAEPEFVAARQNLALCCFDEGDLPHAAAHLKRVLALEPSCRKSRIDLGDILLELGNFEEALGCFEEALKDMPEDDGILNSMGMALQELDNLDRAEECYRQILHRDPYNTLALNNLGTVLRSRALPLQAIECFNSALETAPGDGQLLFNRSLALLAIGDFSRGWCNYESRLSKSEPVKLSHPNLPRWNGEPLAGRSLLVQSEQGYGDTLQFARYLPLLAHSGGPVFFEAQDRSIKSAVENIDPAVTVLARGEPLPTIDCQVALLSLPGIFGTDFDSIPFPTGYLTAAPDKKKFWERSFDGTDNKFRIGLVWGGRKPRLNANRSMMLRDLAPLLRTNGMRFISLQVGEDADQISEFSDQLADMRSHIKDFSDTAALISSLDLVISIDSAVAHLSGALGIPTWVMLKYAPDWRWYLERTDSPWYASVRLFRQPTPGDWESVIAAIKEALDFFRGA